ncbi:MAG: DNA primase [Candidatus Kinetoplastibacterium crithidii]|nr:MAG: DNA primase [Candidatus Kinetoplastibacterium crithidii]
MIPKYFIQDLLSRLDIVEVIGFYVVLKKTGSNLVGLCPFHSEKSPSFTVSQTKKIYHCFGCGAHGDSITFIMEYLALSFSDAVKQLASSVGLTIPDEGKNTNFLSKKQKKERELLSIMNRAQEYYHSCLSKSSNALNYLSKRKIHKDTIDFFGIGWSGFEANFLSKCFDNYNDPCIKEVGLVIDETRRYDRFRQRVMFPIRNYYGNVVGFGGRAIDGKLPKYLNSPETTLFSKRKELYGLWESRKSIKKQGFAIVVEGYFDVIILTQYGVPNVVATLGTSISSDHITKLFSLTNKIIFSFDGDDAGHRAAWKALLICLKELKDNYEIRFLILKENHDPDSYILEYGINKFKEIIDNSISLSKFFINEMQKKHNILEAEGRVSCWNESLSLLSSMPLNAFRIQLEKEIANLLNFNNNDIKLLSSIKNRNLNNFYFKNKNNTNFHQIQKKANPHNSTSNSQKVPSLAKHLLNLIIFNLQYIDDMVGIQQLEILEKQPDLKYIKDLILIIQEKNIKTLETLQESLPKDSELYKVVSNISNHTNQKEVLLPDPVKEWEDALLLIENEYLKKEINLLVEQGLTSDNDINKYKELSNKLFLIKKGNLN